MVTFNKDNTQYIIQVNGGNVDYLCTVRALLGLLANQRHDKVSQVDNSIVIKLIEEMLPTDDQMDECGLKIGGALS